MKTNKDLVARAKFYRGFSDPARLSIVETLIDGPLTVSDIVKKTKLNQSNVSNHLSCLRDCAIVKYVQTGKYVYYELRDERIKDFLLLPESTMPDILESVSECSQEVLDKEEGECKVCHGEEK